MTNTSITTKKRIASLSILSATLELDVIKFNELILVRDTLAEYNMKTCAVNQELVNLTSQSNDYYYVWVQAAKDTIEDCKAEIMELS